MICQRVVRQLLDPPGRLLAAALICIQFGIPAGCGLEPTGHPLAVARIDPGTICRGDDYRTEILLTARDSSPRGLLPGQSPDPDACLVGLDWSISGSEFDVRTGSMSCRPECGTVDDCELVVAFSGEHGAVVTLTVTDDTGATDHAELSLRLTEGGQCP